MSSSSDDEAIMHTKIDEEDEDKLCKYGTALIQYEAGEKIAKI